MAISKYEKPELVEDTLRGFLRLKPTLADTAAYFQVSEKTIERRCKEWGQTTFVDFRNQNMVHTRHALIRKAISMALGGNTAMMIFSLKNICGWKDKQELSTGEEVPEIKLSYAVAGKEES